MWLEVNELSLPSKMQAIEKKTGRPIVDVIQDAYQKFGKQKLVAKELGVSLPTLCAWLSKLGLKQKTIVVLEQAS
jgi:transcriptional regulator with PAS, ATPase and Fis domain